MGKRNNSQRKENVESPRKEISENEACNMTEKEFRVMVMEFIHRMDEKINNLCKNQEEMKSDIATIKNTMESFNSRLQEAEDRISELEDQVQKQAQAEQHLEKKIKKQEESLRELRDNMKRSNMRIIGLPEGQEEQQGLENLFEEIMTENFPDMGKIKVTQLPQEYQNIDDHFLIVSFLPRMSAENIALCHFKTQKVAISNIIKASFPFLELLRDCGFIDNKLYKVGKVYYVTIWKSVFIFSQFIIFLKKSKKCFETSGSQNEVIYNVLSEVEKTFNLTLLKALFSKDIMETYPGLKDIYETFKKVIPNIELFLRSDGEENEEKRDIQQSLEQGDCKQIETDFPLLRGKENGKWA
ncbi:hypothetical protein QTO34_002759 [Cnephaeus nilssonii]|uniref:HSR domain-containing protein n=1 Tax=Cnephaeus nilssonii TaxID=3371016 RepID=A0AA40HSX7_CNENI|nr:hypothetical protein QTO34_002759 [Eptesicus nilssonii]